MFLLHMCMLSDVLDVSNSPFDIFNLGNMLDSAAPWGVDKGLLGIFILST